MRVKNYRILTKLSPPSFCVHAGDISTHDGDNIHAEVEQITNKKKKKSLLVVRTVQISKQYVGVDSQIICQEK